MISTAEEVEVDGRHGRFPKTAHLLRHSDFQTVYKQGRRHFSGNMTVFYLVRVSNDPMQAKEACMGSPEIFGEIPTVAKAATMGHQGHGSTVAGVRIGFTVPKALGKSVDRNRIRRRMREAVRHHLELLEGIPPVDVVFNPKRAVRDLDFVKMSEEVARAFEVIRKNASKKPNASAGRREDRKTV